jgi:hypothetical protein
VVFYSVAINPLLMGGEGEPKVTGQRWLGHREREGHWGRGEAKANDFN